MNWLQRAKAALVVGQNPLTAILHGGGPVCPGRRLKFETLEPRWVMSHVAQGLVDTPQTYSGALNGKIVFTSAGHGWKGIGTSYTTDRPEYWRTSPNNPVDDGEIVEDFGNQDQMTLYADYLLRAGATVVPMRPVGRQLNEVVLDNDSPGVTYSGSWNDSTDPAAAARYYDEDYGAVADFVRYRNATTTAGPETSVATYAPNIPSAGLYPVYTWVARGTNRTTQLYRVNHTGGSTEIRVDHSKVGLGWVYLGTYHFNSGSSVTLGSVQISNSGPAGKAVIADAIRFGNGMGDWIEPGATVISGKPREDENSHHWIARMIGQGTTLDQAIGSGTTNVSAPSNMAEWMLSGTYNPAGGVVDAVYVGFHSNGSTGHPDTATGRRALGLITTSGATPHQSGTNGLAAILGRQINLDMHSLDGTFEVNWVAPPNNDPNQYSNSTTGSFGEIDLGADAEMDATIIEVAFHDNVNDNLLLRDPKARDQIARSVYQGTLEYFEAWGGATNTALPSTPTNLWVVSNASGAVTLNWSAGPSSPASVHGAAVTGYKLYASIDGYGFDGGRSVAGTSTTITGLDPNKVYYFRVAAVNAGGESKPSEVLSALPSGGAKQVLIVNGFDRHDRSQNFRYPYAGGDPEGAADRVWSRYNNSFDYVVQVHNAINASTPGVHVASTSNEAVVSGAVNLADYQAVIWISGTESTVDDTFNATEQTKITQFLAAGGNLFLSGSEIGWDLDQQNNGRTFYENTLKGNYVADDAGTYTAMANAGGIFAGLSNFQFSQGSAFSSLDGQLYNVSTPDVIAPLGGAVAALTYSGGVGGTAAIQFGPGGIGSGSIVMFGFPFEAMTDATRRQQAMGEILDFFDISATMPAVDIKSRVNGQDADLPTGPVLNVGESATFSYEVTNTGDVPLSTIVVTDNNGTPGNVADDFNPTFTGGDTNSNSQLDLGETWTYSAVHTVVAGQYTATTTVTSIFNSQNYEDTDAANYFGAAPAINVESRISGDDADAPTGPVVDPGTSLIFTYQLANTGNVPLSSVVVTDDNGTPGNAADDFSPTFSGGDSNSNGQFDLGESWSYFAFRTAMVGQYAGTATVTAVGNALPVMDTDLAHYFAPLAAVTIQSLIEGDDADSPPGPSLTAGNTAVFTYIVANAGNVPLDDINVTDNNGTPGNAADDFSPTLTSGDTNDNSVLDAGEVWTFSTTRTVAAGQQTHEAIVTDDNAGLGEFDASNYFGVEVVAENADFNRDGIVDAADLIVWLKTNGMTVSAGTYGDANNDTQVDNTDYSIWQEQFGTSPGGGGETVAAETYLFGNFTSTSQPGIADDSPAVEASSSRSLAAHYAAFDSLVAVPPKLSLRSRPALAHQRHFDSSRGDWQLLAALAADQRTLRHDRDGANPGMATSDRAIEQLSNVGDPAKNSEAVSVDVGVRHLLRL